MSSGNTRSGAIFVLLVPFRLMDKVEGEAKKLKEKFDKSEM